MRPGRKSLTLPQQYVNLRGNPLCAGSGCLRGGLLTWRYEASPTPISRNYGVRIEVDRTLSPEVFIDTPDLRLLAGARKLPHVYQQNPARLCLFLPGTLEFRPWMRIDQTIVPWTALWLFYFEDWLASDEWRGGGKHPSDSERQEPAYREMRSYRDAQPWSSS